MKACQQAGFRQTNDFNGHEQAGFGFYQTTTRAGSRSSSAEAYLKPVRDRSNLTVITHAKASRILFENGKASGVRYAINEKGAYEIKAKREVILSGGAINSPQLLMLSGIGPAAHLQSHGIDVVVDAPGVGGNLQDHLDVCTLQRCTQNVTYDKTNDIAIGLNFYLFKQGAGTSNIAETGGFTRSKLAEDERPDVQFHFVPAQLDDHGRKRLPGFGYTLHACFLRPKSRGRISLNSANPNDKPKIESGYLSDVEDFDIKVAGTQ